MSAIVLAAWLTLAATPKSHVTLQEARNSLAEVKRDPQKRRFRHHWEKAILRLEASARGKDKAAALLEAAKARYALYHISAVESDREDAQALARRAQKAGSKEAKEFLLIVRRDAGEIPEVSEPRVSRAKTEVSDRASSLKAPPSVDAEPVLINEIKTWIAPDYTRVAIYLSKLVSWKKEELLAQQGHPRRLALDLQGARIATTVARLQALDGEQVTRVRLSPHNGHTRVVLELESDDRFQIYTFNDPPRLIVDVGRAPQNSKDAAIVSHRKAIGIKKVVIDAGHGGHDTGAIGPSRVREKDVVLSLAKVLSKKLTKAGYEVELTRKTDVFVPLEERTAYANSANADLFISLHANAHPRRDREGVETYFLNVSDDRYAARLAARENGASVPEAESDDDLTRILTDLNAQSSAESSGRLAQMIQREICREIRESVGEVRDLGVKTALFYVLLGARMPAVLVETAFVSNRKEEKRLQSPAYREAVAEAIVRAVKDFDASASPVAQVR